MQTPLQVLSRPKEAVLFMGGGGKHLRRLHRWCEVRMMCGKSTSLPFAKIKKAHTDTHACTNTLWANVKMYSSCMTDLNVNVQRAISRALLPVLLKWIKGVQEVDRNHSPEIDTPPRDA